MPCFMNSFIYFSLSFNALSSRIVDVLPNVASIVNYRLAADNDLSLDLLGVTNANFFSSIDFFDYESPNLR